jgi:hypothetical protein
MKPIIAVIPAAPVAGRPACSGWVLQSKSAVTAVLIALHMVSCMALPLAAQTPADIARAAHDLPRLLDLQTELPRAPSDSSSLSKPDEAGGLNWLNLDMARVVLWTVVVVGTAVLAYCLYEVLPVFGGVRQRWENSADGGTVAAGSGEAAVRAAADELAAQGRFVEAMHVLLLQGLDEMRRRLDLRFADSLTSREIVSRANAPAGAKAALRDIIQWVEHAYFGDHPVDRNDYDACRRSYVTLDGILGAGGRE